MLIKKDILSLLKHSCNYTNSCQTGLPTAAKYVCHSTDIFDVPSLFIPYQHRMSDPKFWKSKNTPQIIISKIHSTEKDDSD